MLWSFIEKFSIYGIQFVIGLFVARILMPSDYGLVGMLAIFMSISGVFIDSGFSRALIQKQGRTEIDFSTVFYFNLFISGLLYGILYFSAPYIAQFYHEPQLILITRVLALNFVIQAFTMVQLTKLSIDMDFKSKAIVNTFSVLISGIVALVMAYQGYGVWALISQTLSKTALSLFLILFIKRWFPKLVFSLDSFKSLFRYGSKLLAAGVLGTIINNLYTILIGRFFTAKEVGYYSKSIYFTNILSATATDVLQTVTFPVMSSVQHEEERLSNIYRKLIRLTMFAVIPCMIGFALICEPFIRLCLTEKWVPAVPIIQWLCIARLFTPVSVLNINLLNAKGYSGMVLKLELIKAPLIVGTLALTIQYGLEAVVIGQAIVSFLCFFINAYVPGKMANYGAFQQIKDMGPTLLATAGMTASILPIILFVPSDLWQLLLSIPIGGAVYYLLSLAQKTDEIKEVNILLQNLINKYFRKKQLPR